MDTRQALANLAGELDQNNAQYVSGEINRDEWVKRNQSLDERGQALGWRLAYRPWEPAAHVPPF